MGLLRLVIQLSCIEAWDFYIDFPTLEHLKVPTFERLYFHQFQFNVYSAIYTCTFST